MGTFFDLGDAVALAAAASSMVFHSSLKIWADVQVMADQVMSRLTRERYLTVGNAVNAVVQRSTYEPLMNVLYSNRIVGAESDPILCKFEM